MKENDYPALWRSSTEAARAAQWWHFFWVRAHLGLLAATGLLAAWTPSVSVPDSNGQRTLEELATAIAQTEQGHAHAVATDHVLSGLVAFLMFSALVVGLAVQLKPMDQAWFQARAFAENAKDGAWRFMMKPRPATQTEVEAEEKTFLDELQQIRGRFPQVEKHLSAHDGGGEELTPAMRDVRAKPVLERLAFYREHRLQDQIDWYRAKAKLNAGAESRWFVIVLIAEALAVVVATVRIFTASGYNPTGAIAAVAACFVAWRQAKRFGDLANTYGVACRDLNGLLTRAEHVHNEAQLSTFVEEVESAVSREHRLWVELRSAT
jgi:hypothetical protein